MKMHGLSERGQAMAETALFAVLAILMAFGLLAWIPTHRAPKYQRSWNWGGIIYWAVREGQGQIGWPGQ